MAMMRNTRMTDEWITRAVQMNPIQVLPDGNIRTCPVRLKFANLFTPVQGLKRKPDPSKTPTYGSGLLFPACAQDGINNVLWPAALAQAKADFPQNWGPDGRWFGLHSPFKDQGEKQTYSGFTPGSVWINVSTQFKPPVVDTGLNPIVDEKRAYDGCWAIFTLNTYSYGGSKAPQPKKGPAFGVQTVMIIADDEELTDIQSADPRAAFQGVQIDASFNPAGQFSGAPPAAPQGFGLLPPALPVGAPPAPPPLVPTPKLEDLI